MSSSKYNNPKQSLIFDKFSSDKRTLWAVNDVAEFLKVSVRTVQDWVYRKKIPFRKAGKALRFSPWEIEQWTLVLKKE